MFGDPAKTVDGFEKTFQINHLGPFLLTRLLMTKLITSQASVIQTTTLHGGMVKHLDLEDLNHDRGLDAIRAYNASKLENVLFTRELHRRYHDQGISAAAVYPGNVATNFASDTTSRLMRFITTNPLTRAALLTSPQKGAFRLVQLASGRPGTDWESGGFYDRKGPGKRLNPLALDADLARRLWDRSEDLTA